VTTFLSLAVQPYLHLPTDQLQVPDHCALHCRSNMRRPRGTRGSKPDQRYALIFGTVWGPDDHPQYGVKVKIRRADQKKAHWSSIPITTVNSPSGCQWALQTT